MEQIVDPVPSVPMLHDAVPHMVEQLVEILARPPRGARTVLCAPQTAEQLVAVPTEPGVRTCGGSSANPWMEGSTGFTGPARRQARAGYKYWPPRRWPRPLWTSPVIISRVRGGASASVHRHSGGFRCFCAEDRMLARCSSWIGTRPLLCNDRARWSRHFSLKVPQVQFLPGCGRPCGLAGRPGVPGKAGRCHSFSSSTSCSSVGFLAHFAHFSRSSGLSRSFSQMSGHQSCMN